MSSNDFSNLISEYGDDLYSFCAYLTGNRYDADDLYQQTWLNAFEKNEIDENRNPRSYLIMLAVNIWKNHIRKLTWRKNVADIVYFEDDNLLETPSENLSVEDEIILQKEKKKLAGKIMLLKPKLRVVILLFYMENMSYDKIAKLLKIPVGTVRSRLNEAKKKLKEMMVDYEE